MLLLNQSISETKNTGFWLLLKDTGMSHFVMKGQRSPWVVSSFHLEPRLYFLKTPAGTLKIPLETGITVTSSLNHRGTEQYMGAST